MGDRRWVKLWRDLRADRARAVILILGIAAGAFGVGTVLGARAILTREIRRSYQGTHPPTVVFELGESAGRAPAVLEEVRRRPDVAAAELRATVHARIESQPVVPAAGLSPELAAMARLHAQFAGASEVTWRPLVLFVMPAARLPTVGSVTIMDHAWPPPDGTIFVERAAALLLGVTPGATIRIRLPGGAPREVTVSGLVHDPGLAPASMERSGWAYATPATLAALEPPGAPANLDELWVTLSPSPADQPAADVAARALGAWLQARGAEVHEVRVPPPDRHPHEGQMRAILLMMLVFSILTLALAGVLAATLIAALLARQVRELGVMKALGARPRQLATSYLALLVGLGTVALAASVPASLVVARAFAAQIATLLNFDLASTEIPTRVLAIELLAGLLLPLAIAAIPVVRAARMTVRSALDQVGATSPDRLDAALARLPLGGRITRMAVRNTFRRRARLALTLGMLALGGSLFLTALDLARAWTRNTDEVISTRHYAVELRLDRPRPSSLVTSMLAGLPGVSAIEAWSTHPAALRRPDELDLVRTYPDGAHGSLRILGTPAGTKLVEFPLLAGRWLGAADRGTVVINHMLAAQAPDLRVGGTVALTIEGRATSWQIVGIVRDVGSPATAYADATDLAAVLGEPGPPNGTSNLLRVAATPGAPRDPGAACERALAAAGIGVDVAIPLTELRTAIGDHMQVLINTLLAMAALMGLVGVLGLGSATSTSVLERTRELGVLRALGATPGTLARLVATEAVATAIGSWVVAAVLSVPLSILVGRIVGQLAFRTPLPFVLRVDALALWLGIVVVVALAAAVLPARRASRGALREALATP